MKIIILLFDDTDDVPTGTVGCLKEGEIAFLSPLTVSLNGSCYSSVRKSAPVTAERTRRSDLKIRREEDCIEIENRDPRPRGFPNIEMTKGDHLKVRFVHEIERTIINLREGEEAYTTYWQISEYGTGFAISKYGPILTSRHPSGTMSVRIKKQREYILVNRNTLGDIKLDSITDMKRYLPAKIVWCF